PEHLARFAKSAGDAMDDLAGALLVADARYASLPEVLADDDVSRKLRPSLRDLGRRHLEHDGTIRVRDDGIPLDVLDAVERVHSLACEPSHEPEPHIVHF